MRGLSEVAVQRLQQRRGQPFSSERGSHQGGVLPVAQIEHLDQHLGGNLVAANHRRHPAATTADHLVPYRLERLHGQVVLLETLDDAVRVLPRDRLGSDTLGAREVDRRLFPNLLIAGVGLRRAAVGLFSIAGAGYVDHQPAQGGVPAVGVQGDEDDPILVIALFQCLAIDRIGQEPAQVDADTRLTLFLGQEGRVGLDRSLVVSHELVAIRRFAAGLRVVQGHEDRGRGLRLELLAQPAGHVVNVVVLPHTVVHRAQIPPAVTRVDDDQGATQSAAGHRFPRQFQLQFGLLGLRLDPAWVILGQKLGLEQGQRDLDLEVHRNVSRIADAAALGDLLGDITDVLGSGPSGETHDHRRVKRLALPQSIGGERSVIVRAVLQHSVVGAQPRAEGGVQHAGRNTYDLALAQLR